MAGIEQLEIHSKSYIVRWVKVDEGNTISWSVQPHKKSINFGIVKHPGSASINLTVNQYETSSDQFDGTSDSKKGVFAKKDSSTAQDQLTKKGFRVITWYGRCEADKVSMGTYDVERSDGGMFGLVFDNTFSKQTSKNATFVLLLYPIGAPPQTAHNLPNIQAWPGANQSKTSLGKNNSPSLRPAASESVDSFTSQQTRARAHSTARSEHFGPVASGNTYIGALSKRRRKKGQGYARRFFSLDYATCTLSYYHNRNSSALRGAIPLSLAAIAADETRREITIDSGAEVWHLKASNERDFTEWARALEKASRIARGLEPLLEPLPIKRQVTRRSVQAPPNTQQEEDIEWQQVEALVSRVVGTRDALRRLVKDMAAQRHTHPHRPMSSHLPPATSALSEDGDYFTPTQEKRPFWKRKSSASITPTAYAPSVSSALAVPSPSVVTTTITANGADKKDKRKSGGYVEEEKTMQDHCSALLSDLDDVVVEFSNLLSNSKRRRLPVPASAVSRNSIESTSTEEFFDAEDAEGDRSQLLVIDHQSEEETPVSEFDEDGASSVSSVVEDGNETYAPTPDPTNDLYPTKPRSLAPLPITDLVKRRKSIPPSTVLPPSLIAFVRKNVGKDLSTISMPVSANEPTSFLQRVAEQMEYASLLDTAAKQGLEKDRLLYVTAFAVSQFSGSRAKERAIRKPFNPLLGETFELLCSEAEVPGGMRLLVEKVTHRPVRLAMQADSEHWSFAQSPAPSQKFWGKSAEINTEGRIRVVLRLPGSGAEERYSWNVATVFLRNVVMGEKYVEPVGTMSVVNDSTGAKATVEFRSKGMFGGRGEDVQVETYGPDGVHTGSSLTGTWTNSLRVVDAGKAPGSEIWRVGQLVENASSTYGMTVFAASLNETTDLETGHLPPTDTRLRPDQRLAEEGRLDEAEEWKVKLEEAQRARRRVLEEKGLEHKPRWFVKIATDPDGEEVWKLKGGKDGYWEERARGHWLGVEDLFSA